MTNDFESHLPTLRNKHGNSIRRSELVAFCEAHRLDVPKLPCLSGGRNPVYDIMGVDPSEAVTLESEVPAVAPAVELTDEEILADIANRFGALDDMAYGVVSGHYRALIVSGNPGIGKTYTLEKILSGASGLGGFTFKAVHGFTRATGLYQLLYENSAPGSVLLLDDCDSVFGDETSLNILKAALDTTKTREVSWYSEHNLKDEDGNELPKHFEYNGAIIFVTNLDFDRAMRSSGRLGPHLEALISRSYYLDLNMRSERYLMSRLAHVVRNSEMLTALNMTTEQGEKILTYIAEKKKQLREVSLRTVVKLANIIKASNSDEEFERVARLACCRQGAAV